MKRLAIYLLAFNLSYAHAQQTDTTQLLPVEVKAVRAPATAPFAKTNLNRRDIEKQNLGQDLPYLLNQTPSVVINSDAGNGVGYTGIHIRGTDATRINITLNGIPYNDAESQGTYFVDLPDLTSSINNIQIQRGVGSSTNGSGAFGASVNLSTNEINKKQYAEINNSYGSYDTWKNTIKFGTGIIGKHFTVDARLSNITSNGYVDRAKTSLQSGYLSFAWLSDKTDIRLNILAGKEKTYQAWYGITADDLLHNRTINYAGLDTPGEPYPNETDNYWQNHYQLFLTHRFSEKLTFNTAIFLTKGRGYYEEYRTAQDYSAYHLPYPVQSGDTIYATDLVRRLWLNNSFYGDVFSLQYNQGSSQLIAGGSVTGYSGKHYGEITWAQNGINGNPRWYDVHAQKNDFTTYVKWQQKLFTGLQSFIDLQYRQVQYNMFGFEDEPQLELRRPFHFFNPKFGLSYTSKHIMAYASFSVANKEPNRTDYESNLNALPASEHLNDVEAGLEYSNNHFSGSANLYYMHYRNQLVLTGKINDVGDYIRTNTPVSYRAGIELQAAWKPCNLLQVSGNITLSRNKILNFTNYIDDPANGHFQKQTDISYSPDITAAATLGIHPFKGFSIELPAKYVGRQFLDNTSSNDRMLDAYYVQDARLNYTLRLASHEINLIAMVYNIWNRKYVANGYTYSYFDNNNLITENAYFPMAPRNYMLGFQVRL